MLDRDPLQRVRDGPSEVLRVARFPLQDHAERENRVCRFLERQFADDHWNFECAWDLMERDRRVG